MVELTQEEKDKRDQKKQDDLLFLLSLAMMNPPKEGQEEAPKTAEQVADALGFKSVDDYKKWQEDTVKNHWTPEQAAEHLPEENLRRITRKPDGSRNEEGYRKLGALAKGSLLSLISSKEGGNDYNTVYGGGNTITYNGRKCGITDLTVNEVLDWQRQQINAGAKSTAAGRFQMIYKTLKTVSDEMGVGNQKYSPELQDRMALKLLDKRGFDDYLAGKISEETFMKNLSQEWASFPKDFSGLSYYAGDGLNKAHVSPGAVLATIRKAREMYLSGASLEASAKAGDTKPVVPADKVDANKGAGVGAFSTAAKGDKAKPAPTAAPAPTIKTGLGSTFDYAATGAVNVAKTVSTSLGLNRLFGWG